VACTTEGRGGEGRAGNYTNSKRKKKMQKTYFQCDARKLSKVMKLLKSVFLYLALHVVNLRVEKKIMLSNTRNSTKLIFTKLLCVFKRNICIKVINVLVL